MKLELKHIAPYLPYGLKIKLKDGEATGVIVELNTKTGVILFENQHGDCLCHLDDVLFLMRPLSDLTKEIEHNGEKFVPIEKLQELYPASMSDIRMIDHEELSGQWMLNTNRDGEVSINIMRQIDAKLFEWNFDVFNLIPNNLALNINKYETKTG